MSSPRKLTLRKLTPHLPLVLALSLAVGLIGCSGGASVLAPASPGASQITNLFWIVFGIAAVIFVLVEGMLVFAVLRFRSRPDAPDPKQVHGNMRLEIAWTVVPALIVIGIFVATVSTMFAVAGPQPGALGLRVIGYQWWWEIQYPDLGITTATDLHVPVGQPVEIELISGDVIHSFWAPELFGKMDVIPGQSNRIRFVASTAGTYRGQCAEFCGTQHANMGFFIIAEPSEQFDEWVEHMRERAAAPVGGKVARGAEAFLTGTCKGCHAISGTSAQGKLGPNLTRFGSRKTIAALTVDNNPENLALWLTDPQAVKPGSKMPALGLSQEVIQDLVAYLESLK